MSMQLLNLIIQPLLGAAAGYITNEYAINMLFNTYTPLKIGGVIPKTRDAFIENISNLVEEDIINKEKVEAIINNEAFIKNFEKLVEDFFTKSIYEVSKNIEINNIPDISKALVHTEVFINKQVELELPKIIDLITKEVSISHIIDETKTEEIVQKLYGYVIKLINETKISNKMIQNIIDNKKNTSLMDILGTNASAKIIENISEELLSPNTIKNNYNDKIDTILNEILQKTNIYSLISEFIAKAINENKSKLQNKISSNLIDFINTPGCEKALLEFSNGIINHGKSLEIPLLSIVNESVIDNIKLVLSNQAPEVFELVVDFVNTNKLDIQNIIEESINETINEQDATKKALLSMAKGSIMSIITKTDMSTAVSEYLSNKNNVENISLLLAVKVKHYLKTTTISQAINLLQAKGVLTAEGLHSFISGYLSSNINSLADKIIAYFTSYINENSFAKATNTKLSHVLKNKIIFSNKTINLLRGSLNDYLSKLLSTNINELLSNLSIDEFNLNDNLCDFMESNQEKIIKGLSLNINNYIKDKKLIHVLKGSSLNKINKASNSFVSDKIHIIKEKLCKSKSYELYNKINSIENLYKNSSRALKKVVLSNLDNLLHKFIHGLSVKNLSKLDDIKLVEMAKSFMGNNLKPIMLFGGMLGLIAGLILAILQPNNNVFAIYSIWGALTFAIVGFMTNAIAINMLFRPYKEIKLIKNIPFLKHFSLGYIVKNKENLANSMSGAIDEYLLTKDSMNELIDVYNNSIKASILSSISKNNYEAINNICVDNKDKIVNAIYNYSVESLNSNTSNLVTLSTEQIERVKLNDFIYDYKDKVSEYIISSKEKYNQFIFSSLAKLEKNNSSLSNILPEPLNEHIKKTTGMGLNKSYDIILSKINYENAKNLLTEYNVEYEELTSKSLASFFSEIQFTEADKLLQNINTGLNSSTEIGSILNKSVSTISNKALNKFFENINTNSSSLLKIIKPTISKVVQEKVTSNLNFLVKGAYNMMDGDKILDTAVEKALLIKLPELIEAKKDDVFDSLSGYLNNKLLKLQLKDIGLSINEGIISSEHNNLINELLGPIYAAINKKSSEITIKDILEPLSLDSIQAILSSYESDFKDLVGYINSKLSSNKNHIILCINEFIDLYLKNTIDNATLSNLFKNISSEELKSVADNITTILTENKLLNKNINDALTTIKDYDNPIYTFDLINKDDFNRKIEKELYSLLDNSKTKDVLLEIINNVFNKATLAKFDFIDVKAKDYLLNTASDAVILTLRNNLNQILIDIKFDKITKEQINEMDPKKIHSMFNSFADKYFRTLMLYGLFGAIFGINTILGLVLSGVYCIKNISTKNN